MATHLKTELVLNALDAAVAQRQPQSVVLQSDHATQYTSIAFGQRCRQAGVRPSMGTIGDAYDNALCESDALGEVDLILVTHAHGDHLSDAVPLSGKNNAPLYGPAGMY